MTKRMFYVSIDKNDKDRGFSTCVDDPAYKGNQKLIKEFFKECAGHEIRHVDGDEMMRLMTK